ncbi:MAG: hypothetical protein ACQEP1_00520 [Nanobdellota archaeon]
MNVKEGKYTVETFAEENGLSRQAALNKLSRLRKEGHVKTSGGGSQKRIYTISKRKLKRTNGFYDIINRYSPIKLVPKFEHEVKGRYTIEHAIIDGISIGDSRTLEATKHLFRHVKNWKRLFDLAKKHNKVKKVKELYWKARKTTKCRRIPARYEK